MDAEEAFRIEGFVADKPMVARWVSGSLQAPVELLRRVQALARLGDDGPEGMRERTGGESGPMSALLYLMRAFDMVTVIESAIGAHRAASPRSARTAWAD